jgi:hypothetical protein
MGSVTFEGDGASRGCELPEQFIILFYHIALRSTESTLGSTG